MITKFFLKKFLICNRTNKQFPGTKSCSELVTGNFLKFEITRGSGNFQQNRTSQTGNKVHRIIGSFFSSFRRAAHAHDQCSTKNCAQSVSLVRHGRQQVRNPRTRSQKKSLRM